MAHHSRIRWYNPKLEAFEWREVPEIEEDALSLLDGTPHSPRCTQTYLEWRNLGAPIASALMRARQPRKTDTRRTFARGTASGGPLRLIAVPPGSLLYGFRHETPA